jgi:hypothetical protein
MSRKRLKTIEDVRRYLANLINRTEAGKVDPQLAGRLGYLASILKSCIESGEIERRLSELEEKISIRAQNH